MTCSADSLSDRNDTVVQETSRASKPTDSTAETSCWVVILSLTVSLETNTMVARWVAKSTFTSESGHALVNVAVTVREQAPQVIPPTSNTASFFSCLVSLVSHAVAPVAAVLQVAVLSAVVGSTAVLEKIAAGEESKAGRDGSESRRRCMSVGVDVGDGGVD